MKAVFVSVFLLCLSLLFGSTSFAQAVDPYAREYQQMLRERSQMRREQYKERRAIFLERARTYYFAAACGALRGGDKPGIGEAFFVVAMAYKDLEIDDADFEIPADLNRAKLDGAALARTKGCDYWHQHPEEVFAMRQLAEKALSPGGLR